MDRHSHIQCSQCVSVSLRLLYNTYAKSSGQWSIRYITCTTQAHCNDWPPDG